MRLKTLQKAKELNCLFVYKNSDDKLNGHRESVIVCFETNSSFRVIRNKTQDTNELVDDPRMVAWLKKEMILRKLQGKEK